MNGTIINSVIFNPVFSVINVYNSTSYRIITEDDNTVDNHDYLTQDYNNTLNTTISGDTVQNDSTSILFEQQDMNEQACPHCGKIGDITDGRFMRWHFDNCNDKLQ